MFSNQALESMLKEIIDREIKNTLKDKGFETPYEGRVESVSPSLEDCTDPYKQRASVFIIGYDTTVNLQNKTGEKLTAGNKVRVYTTNGNLANGYIGIKCK